MPLLLVWLAVFFWLIGSAQAQLGPPDDRAISYLNNSGGTAATFVSPQNPLPTTATISGTVTANTSINAISTLPTLGPGTQVPQGSLAGAAYVQPVYGSATGGGSQVDLTHGLPVQIVGGSSSSLAIASATFPSLSAGPQSLYENLMGQLYVDHPTLDVTGQGSAAGALRVVPANGSLIGVSISPPTDMLAGPTAISSGGTPSLAINTNGTSSTQLVLSGSAGLTAIFQCSINGSFQGAQAFNHATGFTESGATGNGVWTFPSAGCAQIVITATAGSTTATMEASAGPPVPPVSNAVYLSSPTTLSN